MLTANLQVFLLFHELGYGDRYYSEKVDVAVFDTLFPQTGTVAFVKIDTEGHEAHVLAGMKVFLTNNNVTLQIELYDDAAAKFLNDLGYRQFHKFGSDAWFMRA
jgi:Methyltransferase FkbM domain